MTPPAHDFDASAPGRSDNDQTTRMKATATTTLLTLLPLTLLCSCATPYRPTKGKAGYSERQIAPDRFAVRFQGNGSSTLEQVYDFALLRAAEVARLHGFCCFAVLDVTNTTSVKSYTVPPENYSDRAATPQIQPYAVALPRVQAIYYSTPDTLFGPWPGIINQPAQTRDFIEPGTILFVQYFAVKPDKPFTYDASGLQQTLTRKYKLK